MKHESAALSGDLAAGLATISGDDPAFRDASIALTVGSRLRSAQFSAQAFEKLPHLAARLPAKDARLNIRVHGMAWNAKYRCDELLYWVTLPGTSDGISGHYFARALTALSPLPVTLDEGAALMRSDWFANPLKAIKAAADAQGRPCDYELALSVLRESADWCDITPASYLDDVLAEIAGKTHIVCEYGSTADEAQRGHFRAYYDLPTEELSGTAPASAGS